MSRVARALDMGGMRIAKALLLWLLAMLVANASPKQLASSTEPPAKRAPIANAQKLQAPKPPKPLARFGFQGARDVVRSFALTPSPIRLDPCVRSLLEPMDPARLEGFAELAADFGASWLANMIASVDRPKRFAHARSLQAACNDRYAKAFAQARLERSILAQAKAALFQAMLQDPAKRDDSAMYLLLAKSHLRLWGFYDIQALRVYIQAYIQKGGEIASLPKPLRLLVESSLDSTSQSPSTPVSNVSKTLPNLAPLSLESTLHALISANLIRQDSGFVSHGFFSRGASAAASDLPKGLQDPSQASELIFARVLELGERQCVVLLHARGETKAAHAQLGLSGACFPRMIDEVVLFPFDGRLYVLAGAMLYGISPSPSTDTYELHAYARLVFSKEQGEGLCAIEAIDTRWQEHASMDLNRAGFMPDSPEQGLRAWSEEIAAGDENMHVEYLGHLDVFNEGRAVPIARAYTTMGDRRERFYEAFTLAPATLAADISLSHPTMFLQGRLPSLRFVRFGGEILGCVGTPRATGMPTATEEKLFRFRRNSLPELVRHQRLRSILTSIEPLESGVQDSGGYDRAMMSARAFGEDVGLVYLGYEILEALGVGDTAMDTCSSAQQDPATTRMPSSPKAPKAKCALESIRAQIESHSQREN